MYMPTIENEVLKSFYHVLSYLPSLFDDDAAFGVSDTERYLKVLDGEILKTNIKDGDYMKRGDTALEAIQTGKIIVKDIPKEVYGIPFKTLAIPVKDKGNIVGVLSIGKSIEVRNEVLNFSKNLSTSIEEIDGIIHHLFENIEKVLQFNEEVLATSEEANESVKDTDGILKFVQSISGQTNMLGLNASIEAARAGEFGRGFSVVAEEIRKLANSSSESIKKIDDVLKAIIDSIENINGNIKEGNVIFKEQVNSFSQIISSIENLSAMAKKLEDLSYKL